MSEMDPLNGADTRFERILHAARQDAAPHSAASARAAIGSGFAAHSFPGCRVVREISRGAQGVVLEAVQTGTQRRVAIKVLREGLIADAREKLRFEQEVLVLGRLRHPNIVAIHESGTVDGHFYYVMDHIDGQRLDVYLASSPPLPKDRAAPLSVKETLQLFKKICEAVNAAHLAGVIHRDLKPGNILVDSSGEPHVLDFGLAKRIAPAFEFHPPEGQTEVQSLTTHFVGTPQWASPEQVEGESRLLDTRTDVYSLGVILYHMLTGRFPYPVVGSLRQIFQNIVATEPARPRALRRVIDAELETLLLKCLAKDRDRRYSTAGDLARDIERYLHGDPIEARSDSRWYLARKAARRYRIHIAVSIGVGACLLAATMISLLSAQRAHDAELSAKSVTVDKSAVVEIFKTAIQMSIPVNAQGRDISVLRDAILYSSKAINGVSDPALKIDLHCFFAEVYGSIGEVDQVAQHVDEALRLAESSFTQESVEYAAALNSLARRHYEMKQFDACASTAGQALAILERIVEGPHKQIIFAYNWRGVALESLAGPSFVSKEAEGCFRAALDMADKLYGPNAREMASRLNNLGLQLKYQKRWPEAEKLYRRALAIDEEVYGTDHLETAYDYHNLGTLLRSSRVFEEAKNFLRKAHAIRVEQLGKDNESTALSAFQLGLIYLDTSPPEVDRSIFYLEEALEAYEAAATKDVEQILIIKEKLGFALTRAGRFVEAEALLREVVRERAAGGDAADLLRARILWGGSVAWRKDASPEEFAEAERVLLDVKDSLDPNVDIQALDATLRYLEMLYRHQGMEEKAAEFQRRLGLADGHKPDP